MVEDEESVPSEAGHHAPLPLVAVAVAVVAAVDGNLLLAVDAGQPERAGTPEVVLKRVALAALVMIQGVSVRVSDNK